MACTADAGLINPSWQNKFLPSWMWMVIVFYMGLVIISERIVPLLKDLADLVKQLKDN
jgi:hypothetical protein